MATPRATVGMANVSLGFREGPSVAAAGSSRNHSAICNGASLSRVSYAMLCSPEMSSVTTAGLTGNHSGTLLSRDKSRKFSTVAILGNNSSSINAAPLLRNNSLTVLAASLSNCRSQVVGESFHGCLSFVVVCKPSRRSHPGLRVVAIDAAQEFDYESMKLIEIKKKNRLVVGIVGFGNFGQFLAERFMKQGHKILAHSRSDYSHVAAEMGITYFRDADDFCEEHPDVVVLCTSILSTEAVLRSLPVQRLKRNTLLVDVLSVKEFPRNLFLQVCPPNFDLLCTHPMFGPESGSGSWRGLPFVYDKIRVKEGYGDERCRKFLNIFEREGCRMVEMSCEEHDRHAAGSQFITHTVGRVLGSLGLESTPINTKGYESLLKLVANTHHDSFDLYYGLFLYNNNATEELVRLERAFDCVKSQLFDKLHNILRRQLLSQKTALDVSRTPVVKSPMKALTSSSSEDSIANVGPHLRTDIDKSPIDSVNIPVQIQQRLLAE